MTRVIYREGGCRREGIEVLAERIGGNGFVVGGDEVIELDGKEI